MIKQKFIRRSKKKSVVYFFPNQHNDIVMTNTEQWGFATKQHTAKSCYIFSLQWRLQEINISDLFLPLFYFHVSGKVVKNI